MIDITRVEIKEKNEIKKVYDENRGYNFTRNGELLLKEWFTAATDFVVMFGVRFAYVVNRHEQVYKVDEIGNLLRVS